MLRVPAAVRPATDDPDEAEYEACLDLLRQRADLRSERRDLDYRLVELDEAITELSRRILTRVAVDG